MSTAAPSSMRNELAVASPCTSVCTIDQRSGLCAGCFRTLDEIAAWGRLSDDEKRSVLRELPVRRDRFGS